MFCRKIYKRQFLYIILSNLRSIMKYFWSFSVLLGFTDLNKIIPNSVIGRFRQLADWAIAAIFCEEQTKGLSFYP